VFGLDRSGGAWSSFTTTFAATRTLTHWTRAGYGPASGGMSAGASEIVFALSWTLGSDRPGCPWSAPPRGSLSRPPTGPRHGREPLTRTLLK
jgi:hypothetical protein